MGISESPTGYWDFRGRLIENAFVSIQMQRWGNRFTLYYDGEMGVRHAILGCRGTDMIQIRPHDEWGQFVPQWLPFFRRGCFLSGCGIEASAHEKAEWMQGFNREEIDVWNLKM